MRKAEGGRHPEQVLRSGAGERVAGNEVETVGMLGQSRLGTTNAPLNEIGRKFNVGGSTEGDVARTGGFAPSEVNALRFQTSDLQNF